MKSSEQIAKLASALAKAQGRFKAAAKDAVNPHFRNRYADLASIWDAIREPLSINGLAVVQGAETSAKEALVTTTLLHESGEWIQSTVTIPVVKGDAQGVGSAITYGRRYGLTALVGITQDDDDGETAVGRGGGTLRSNVVVVKGGGGGKLVSPPVSPQNQAAVINLLEKNATILDSAIEQEQLLHAVFELLKNAETIDALKAVWEEAQQFAKHPDFPQVVKAKDEAKARLSTGVPARTRAVAKRKPEPEPEPAPEPAAATPAALDEDDIPFA